MRATWTAWVILLLQVCWLTLGRDHGLCLDDGVPDNRRMYVQDLLNASGAGPETPIRLVVFDWASARVATALAAIFIREVLGYHTVITPEIAPGSFDGVLALAGCSSADCSQRQAQSHVAMDCWMTEISFNFDQFVLANPDVAPVDLGSIGYSGENSLSVKGSIRDAAYAGSGLALEFYRSYNASAHDAAAYFDRISDLNHSHFSPCNTTGNEFANDVEMRLYRQWTDDWEGVVETETGYIANCPDGLFWISPACRHNTSECIPILAAGNGWIVYVFMQWATFYGIPAAVGTAATWEDYAANVVAFRTLFHWWMPDATFHQLDASMLQFPRHRAREWAVGNYRTADGQSNIVKLIAQPLQLAAPRVQRFLQNFDLDLEDMQSLLRKTSTSAGATTEEVACEWIRANRDRWEKWVPVQTQCLAGYGLVDDAGQHVPDRRDAVACSVCLAGTFSEPWSDDLGQTHRCTVCPAGTHQNSFGETGCAACDVGTFTGDAGNAQCERCELGRYANTTGTSECQPCGGEHRTTSRRVMSEGIEKWIEVDGATSESSCGCLEDWYLTAEGPCEKCPFGSTCPGSSKLLLLPGFYATQKEPGQVFRCFGLTSRCPGGPPGSCNSGRDPGTVTCAACLVGLQPMSSGECGPCTGASYLVLVGTAVLGICGVVVIYAILAMDAQRVKQPGHLFVIFVALSQLVTVLQQLAVITKFDIQWEQPMAGVMNMFSFMTLDLDVLSFSCVAPASPVGKYALTTLATPLLAVVAAFIHLSALAAKKRLPHDFAASLDSSQLLRTIGSLFLLLFISVFASILAPFQCNLHPNGRLTLQEYDSVFCSGKDEHLQMSIIGGLAALMPLFFVALCIRATWVELPKRLLRADAKFVRSCSFLWRRFRPGAETFAVLGLTRNVLMVLCPLIPAAAVQLVVMNIILYLSLVTIAVAQPWRLPMSNVLDIWLHIGLLVVLDMASVFAAQDVDVFVSTFISMMFLIFMIAGVLGAILWGIVMQVARWRRKPWRFFLSHHKSSTGAAARLLKIHLQKRSPFFTTFLDTDNLRDLTELFHFVKDSETVLVLASPAILARKWCVGEIVTAKQHDIHTVLLKWPTFQYPTETFRKNLTFAIPGVEALAAHGISPDDVSLAMKWLGSLNVVPFPDLLDADSLIRICDNVTGTVSSVKDRRNSSKESPIAANCLLLADPANQEAVATCYILDEMLVSLLKGELLPLMLRHGEPILEQVDAHWKVLLICTSGCLKSSDLAAWLVDLYEPSPVILPIIADPNFLVPTEPYTDACDVEAYINDYEREVYVKMIGIVFQEIATVFAPQSHSSTQEDLELRVKQIAFRVQAKGTTEWRMRVSSMHSVPSSTCQSRHSMMESAINVLVKDVMVKEDFISF